MQKIFKDDETLLHGRAGSPDEDGSAAAAEDDKEKGRSSEEQAKPVAEV